MFRRVISIIAAVAAVLAASIALAPAASAAVPHGHVDQAYQSTSTHTVTIAGWTYDPARPSASLSISVYFDGHYKQTLGAHSTRLDVDHVYHIRGSHGFRYDLRWPRTVHTVLVVAHSASRWSVVARLSGRVRHVNTSPGARIVAVARRYVGRVPYVEGGASPRGFDCSGYTQYAYRVANVARLPRTAEEQRRAVRHISRAQARPGDLVFYLSGGSAYHVAIYAGGGRQYAAATPRDGIRFQSVWSSAVQYGTTWH